MAALWNLCAGHERTDGLGSDLDWPWWSAAVRVNAGCDFPTVTGVVGLDVKALPSQYAPSTIMISWFHLMTEEGLLAI